MSRRGLRAGQAEPLSRAFYEMARVLASADGPEARVLDALDTLHSIVPYDRCAVLEALPGRAPRLMVPRGTTAAVRRELLVLLPALLVRLVAGQGDRRRAAPEEPDTQLAVSLVGLDGVVGLLYVSSGTVAYGAGHGRVLAVVAAKLAAYLSMLEAATRELEHGRQLEEARQAAEGAQHARDEFLAQVSRDLRMPLTPVPAWADAVRSPDTPEGDRMHAYEALERSVRAQVRLIEDRLALSSLAEGRVRLPPPGEALRALGGIQVLVLDGDMDIREMLQVVLEGEGAQVSLAGTAAEALAALERALPDVLMSGIARPGALGYELCHGSAARDAVLMVLAPAPPPFVPESLGAAPSTRHPMHLARPIDLGALVGAVASLARSPDVPRRPGEVAR